MKTPTVFHIDDNASVRSSFEFLAHSVGLAVKSFASALEFLEVYTVGSPGCLILDMRMPAMNGLQLQQEMKSRDIHLPIIFVSGHVDVPLASEAFRAGAIDVLTKPVNNNHLIERIREALTLDEERREASDHSGKLLARVKQLTPRERDTLLEMLKGKSIKQIAGEFAVSPQTAAKHRARVLCKLEVENEVLLARMLTADDLAE